VLRYLFVAFWFIGPAMVALYCAAKVGDVAMIGGMLAKGCATGAVLLGIGGATAFIAFGSVMAIATAFAGWLTVNLIILMTNSRVLKGNSVAALWSFAGLGAFLIVMVWGVYRDQIKRDRAVLKKYEADQVKQEPTRNIVYFPQEPEEEIIPEEMREAA